MICQKNGPDCKTDDYKNPDNTYLVMLIFKAMWIPDIHKSPGELLNARKYRTNLPTIDLNQEMNEPEI